MKKLLYLFLLTNQYYFAVLIASIPENNLLQKAQANFQHGNYDKALDYFKKSAVDSRFSTRARIGLVQVLFETGRYANAEKICQQVLTKSPNQPEISTLLASLFKITGRYDEARARLQTIVAQYPDFLQARLELGKIQWEWGERTGARKTLQYFISYYHSHQHLSARELSLIAQACVYLNRFRDANRLFNDAVTADSTLWQAFVPWGELMLTKYNVPDARGIFEDALKINPNAVAANLGLAKSLRNTEHETTSAEKALEVNPNCVAAFNYLAELDLAHGKNDETISRLDKALVINPNSVSARTLRAMVYYFSNNKKKYEEEKTRILSINPRSGELYYQLAEQLSKRYLFAESVGFYKQAIELQPEHWSAYAGLGTSLSRLGRETEAKQKLERAFAQDSYNKHVGNLLRLFEEFPDYKTHKTRYLTIKIHKKDNAVLAPYATALANESFSHLLKLYPISGGDKIILEIFPTHDDFAVRCFGLPGAQAFLGICFGNVVAMDSPRARGDFVWGETMWHELVHVTHLRLTANRIPRWLAEGIAVYETSSAKPHWAMRLDWPLIMAYQHGRLLPLKDLDAGFNRPTSPGQVSLSYFQASIIVEFIINKYGRSKLLQMFPEFKKGSKTPEVIKKIFSKDVDLFDEDFHKFVEQKYRLEKVDYTYNPQQFTENADKFSLELPDKVRESPNNPFLNFHYGVYLKDQGEDSKAIIYLEKARILFPGFTDKQNPYKSLAEIYLEHGEKKKALRELQQLTTLNGKDAATLFWLAELSMEQEEFKTAIEALRKVIYINPYESGVHQKLARAYLADEQHAKAIAELQINLLTRPQDMAAAFCDLADAYIRAGRKREAKKNALAALEIAPGFERAQEILLTSIE